jgi:hypothetical protein
MRWVTAIVNSVGNIALGAIPAAIGFIVESMKTMIPVILDFFAKLLNYIFEYYKDNRSRGSGKKTIWRIQNTV